MKREWSNELGRSEPAGAQATVNRQSERPQSARERSVSPLPSNSLTAIRSRVARRSEHGNRASNIFRMTSGGPGGHLTAATECPRRRASGLCAAVRSAAPAAARARRNGTSQRQAELLPFFLCRRGWSARSASSTLRGEAATARRRRKFNGGAVAATRAQAWTRTLAPSNLLTKPGR